MILATVGFGLRWWRIKEQEWVKSKVAADDDLKLG